jgi:aryl-alcohol dehydrogenase-like predicted oxidoreductase
VDAILDEAAERGINLIDTAECYGDHLAERLTGDYLARRERGRWFVASKFGHRFHSFMNRSEDFTPEGVREQLEASLRALRAERIDLYQFHSGADEWFANEELWRMLEEQKRMGKVRLLGISILGKGSERQAREARARGVDVLQVIYNRLDRRPETMYFPHAERDGLGVLARVPLASGLLSGKYGRGAQFPEGDYRSTVDPAKLAADVEEALRLAAEEVPEGMAMAEWALRWCLRHPAVIPGCKSAEQARMNARAGE